jgi:hypothetical protein
MEEDEFFQCDNFFHPWSHFANCIVPDCDALIELCQLQKLAAGSFD